MKSPFLARLRNRILAFTLTELVVSFAILAILATVGTVSYLGYSSTSRDSARTQDIKVIYDLMTVYRTNHSQSVNVGAPSTQLLFGTQKAGQQGEVSSDVVELIDAQGGVHDPSDPSLNYTYLLDNPGQLAQLMAYLENNPLGEQISYQRFLHPFETANAAASLYATRFPYVGWDEIGTLIDTDKTPLQRVFSGTSFDITTYSVPLTALFTNNTSSGSITGTGGFLSASILASNLVCGQGKTYTDATCVRTTSIVLTPCNLYYMSGAYTTLKQGSFMSGSVVLSAFDSNDSAYLVDEYIKDYPIAWFLQAYYRGENIPSERTITADSVLTCDNHQDLVLSGKTFHGSLVVLGSHVAHIDTGACLPKNINDLYFTGSLPGGAISNGGTSTISGTTMVCTNGKMDKPAPVFYTCSGTVMGNSGHLFTLSPALVVSVTNLTATGVYTTVQSITGGTIAYHQSFKCLFDKDSFSKANLSLDGNETADAPMCANHFMPNTNTQSCECAAGYHLADGACIQDTLPVYACSATATGSLGHAFALSPTLSVSATSPTATGTSTVSISIPNGTATYRQQFRCQLDGSGATLAYDGNETLESSVCDARYAPDSNHTCICAAGYATIGEHCSPVPVITRVDVTCGSPHGKYNIDIIASMPSGESTGSLVYKFYNSTGSTSYFSGQAMSSYNNDVYIVNYIDTLDSSLNTSNTFTGTVTKPTCP